MPEYVHIWLIKLPQKQLFNIKRSKDVGGWGPGQVRDVERGWEEAEGGGSGRHRDGCWSPCYPKTPVRARGSQPSSHTNRLREQSYFSVPVFSSEKQIVALNSVNCYSSISCKMETERRKRKK